MSTNWKWFQNISCSIIVLDDNLPELSVNCNKCLIQSRYRVQPPLQVFHKRFSFLNTNMQESFHFHFCQFNQSADTSTLLSYLYRLKSLPTVIHLQRIENKCLDLNEILSFSTFVRSIWWNSNSSSLKEFSSSSFSISPIPICDPNAQKLQYLQNNNNQLILSNCVNVLSYKDDTFTFDSLKTKIRDNSDNWKKLNKVNSQTHVHLKEQNDLSSTTSLNKNKNKLDDCNPFASASSQTELCNETSMSSTKIEINLIMIHRMHCYKTFQLVKELDVNKEKQIKLGLSTNTNKQNEITQKTVLYCRPNSGSLSSSSSTDYSNNIGPDMNFDIKPLFNRSMNSLHWRQPSLFVQQPEQGKRSFETTFHEPRFDIIVPSSDFKHTLFSVDSFRARDFPNLQTFQDKNLQTSTSVLRNLPNYGQVEKPTTSEEDSDFINFQTQTNFSQRSFSISTADNSNSRNKNFIRWTKSNKELSFTNTYFTTRTIPSSSSMISVKNSDTIDDETHASKFFLNNILYENNFFYVIC